MEDLKQVVAANMTTFRKERHLTQAQLANQLHYSDKAVSKWERGESLPDLLIMKQLADFYGIQIDDFLKTAEERAVLKQKNLSPPQTENPEENGAPEEKQRHNHLMIAGMSALLVWLIASLIFVVLDTAVPGLKYGSFLFLYALPVTAVVCLVFNSVWFNPRRNYLIISVLVWSLIAAIFFTLYRYRIWKLFFIGIPAQLIIVLWSRLRPVGRKKDENQRSKQKEEKENIK